MSDFFKQKQDDFDLKGNVSKMATPYDEFDAHRTVANRLGMSMWVKLKPEVQQHFANIVLRRAS